MAPVSQYFNNYSPAFTNEQRLMEDMIVESIKIIGHNCYYIPREMFDETDYLFGENARAKFTRSYLIEMYLANVQGYEGDGDFFSKFGLDIRDTTNLVVSRRSFEKYVPSSIARRPREGDLIFVPLIDKLFEVKFIEEELMFFSIGNRQPYIYEMRCEMYRFNQGQNIETGVEEVDIVGKRAAYKIELTLNNPTGSDNFHIGEVVYQGANLEYATATAEVKDWVLANNQIYLIDINGNFNISTNLKGSQSGAIYNVTTKDGMDDFVDFDLYDNRKIQNEINNFIDLSESNPFGNP